MLYAISAQKKGYFSDVCKSKSAKTTNASMCSTSLCAIHKTPDCLTHASLTALIANTEVSALIDTGSSSSFINADTAERLGMKIIPFYENISMASSLSTENIHGYCNTDVQINGSDYNDVKLKVLKNLCSDILLGQYFLSQHRQVIFKLKGKKDDFVVRQLVHFLWYPPKLRHFFITCLKIANILW